MSDEQTSNRDFSGMWRCAYWYPSNTKPGQQEISEYYCKASQRGDRVVFESVSDQPHMVVNLTIDHTLATGNWVENTDPNGEFEGLEYSGAIQLLVNKDATKLDGMWVGVGREKLDDGSYEPRIYSGKWEMVRAGKDGR